MARTPTRWIASWRSSRAPCVSGMWRASIRLVIGGSSCSAREAPQACQQTDAGARVRPLPGPRSALLPDGGAQQRRRRAEAALDRLLDADGVETALRQQ